MIRAICKYYLRFPPLARTAIELSFQGAISCVGIDYYGATPEHLLMDCDILLSKKIFS